MDYSFDPEAKFAHVAVGSREEVQPLDHWLDCIVRLWAPISETDWNSRRIGKKDFGRPKSDSSSQNEICQSDQINIFCDTVNLAGGFNMEDCLLKVLPLTDEVIEILKTSLSQRLTFQTPFVWGQIKITKSDAGIRMGITVPAASCCEGQIAFIQWGKSGVVGPMKFFGCDLGSSSTALACFS